jgi:membrane protease YdiL (CAAX protease family)
MTVASPQPRGPFWSYEDLALLVGAVLPIMLIASLAVRTVRPLEIQSLAFNGVLDVLLIGALYMLVSGRYQEPFWKSLHFDRGWRLFWICLPAGAVLAIVATALGVALRAPVVPNPVERMVAGRWSLALVGFFAVVLAPLFEELFFRGFLFPLLARSLGAWLGIVLSAAPFALLHGQQYQWSWQHIAVIGLAGFVFGFVRYRTDSTAASALVHAGYNLLYFAGFLLQRWLAK